MSGGGEPSGGALDPGEELEAALREASAALDAHPAQTGPGGAAPGVADTPDKITIEALSNELQALKEEYETTTKELEELRERHVRLQAEFDNFRRRGLKERQEAHQFGHQNLVKDLLATVDNLDRAIEHAEKSEGEDLQGLLQGVELVRRELLGALGQHGVSVIEALGQPFDPALHEAMAQIPDDSVASGTVVQVLQKGYELRDRMLRPARVVVSKASEEAGATSGSGDA